VSGEIHRRRQPAGLARQRGGRPVDAPVEIGDLVRLHQPEMALGKGDPGIAGQGAQPLHAAAQALAEHGGVTLSRNAVGQRRDHPHVIAVGGQPMDQRAEALRHGAAVHHRQHRQAEAGGQIGGGRIAVEQAHHPFDEDEIGLARGIG
jgi:hypothetical protein